MRIEYDTTTQYYKATFKQWHTYGATFGQALSNMLGIINNSLIWRE